MKAEHRHELKTNELAEWLMNLPAWAQENLRTIIYVTVVLVVVVAYTIWYRYQKTVVAGREQTNLTSMIAQIPQLKAYVAQTQTQPNTDNSYMLMQPAEELEKVAAGAKDDSVAAMALIKQGDILRAELQFRPGVISRQDFEERIAKAKGCYARALEAHLKRSPNRPLEALAKMGLGLCEEELGNSGEARKIYEELATGAAFKSTTSAAAAKQRLALISSFNQKIVLLPAPKPVIPVQTEIPLMQTPQEANVQIVPEVNAQVQD